MVRKLGKFVSVRSFNLFLKIFLKRQKKQIKHNAGFILGYLLN